MNLGSPPLRIVVLFNRDYSEPSSRTSQAHAAGADVAVAARGVAASLGARGHEVSLRPVDTDDLLPAIQALAAAPPDVVFNLVESLGADARNEAIVPSLLELFGIACTGSGALALSLALRKDLAREVVKACGVPIPDGVVLRREDLRHPGRPPLSLAFPLIVKPTREDASVGIHSSSVVHDLEALAAVAGRLFEQLDQPVLVERYIEGREICVSLLGNQPRRVLPLREIDFRPMPPSLPRIVSYAAKWEPGTPEYLGTPTMPCVLGGEVAARVERVAIDACAALGVRDYGRVDVRLAEGDLPFVIDVNPNCDLSEEAGFSRSAEAEGMNHGEVLEAICRAAVERHAQQGGSGS